MSKNDHENRSSLMAGSGLATVIRYPRYKALREQIDDCILTTTTMGEPQCMSIEGPPGAGKTTLIKDVLSDYREGTSAAGLKLNTLYVPTPDNTVLNALISECLNSLGDPAAYKIARKWEGKARLRKYLKELPIRLLCFDDFQHVLRAGDATIGSISEWLKTLIKDTGICAIVVGIQGGVEPVLEANEQLSRLFAARETLTPFVWNADDSNTIREFALLIHYIEQSLNMPIDDQGCRLELLGRLCYATNGVIGNLMNLLRLANHLANKTGQDQITTATLSLAFQTRLEKHLKSKSNPFLQPLAEAFVFEEFPVDRANATGNRIHGGKPRPRSASDVLST
ncbi:MAG: TniB family NTP-binding protein [Chloroflexota bacterium]